MKVIYCGTYRENSGYGQAAREYIRALHIAGLDILCRPTQFSPGSKTSDDLIKSLENKNFDSPADVIIQHCPAYSFQYVSPHNELNVGIFYCETYPISKLWEPEAKLMDLIVSSNKDMTNQFLSKGIRTETVNIPIDEEKYKKQYKCPDLIKSIRDKNKTIFYSIGEYSKRKNFEDLVKAYCTEFKFNESVALVIRSKLDIQKLVDNIKNSTKITRFPDIYCIEERLSEEEMYGLHQNCDIFVQPSYSESWGFPALDSCYFGKSPIVPNFGGYREYLNEDNAYLIPCLEEYCYGEGPIHAELFTGNKKWMKPDFGKLRLMMRSAYENNIKKHIVPDLSYKTIGLQFKKVLEKYVEIKRSKGINHTGTSLD